MLFRGRYDKQMERIKEKNKNSTRAYDEKDVRNAMEKGDLPAMIIAALLTIVPIALLFLLAISFLGFKFIAR